MTQDNRLSVLDIARELNTGKATIKFLLKRFKALIPFELIDGQPIYPGNTISILLMIQEKLEMGLLPSEIEKALDTQSISDPASLESSLKEVAQNSDIRLSHDGLHMLKSLFSDIGQQQERIAAAHEKRAQVEERKALAIEKRAQAEEKKALAMNNIATALQEMNQLRSSDATTQQIVHQAGSVIIADESDEPYETDNLSELISDSDPIDDTDTDLSSLLEEDDIQPEPSIEDPLSDESDPEPGPDFDQELEDSLDDPLKDFDEDLNLDEDLLDEDISSLEKDDVAEATTTSQQALDDLSILIDNPKDTDGTDDNTTDNDVQTDDLSSLIEEKTDAPKTDAPALDDLSLLIDTVTNEESKIEEDSSEKTLDDLSSLIDEKDVQSESEPAMNMEQDDLSKLIDSTENKDSDQSTDDPDLDDLSLLITSDTAEQTTGPDTQTDNAVSSDKTNDLDDLSKLIDPSQDSKGQPLEAKSEKETAKKDEEPLKEDTAPIIVDISPEDDLGKYKAAITKIIIELKTDGLTVEEATDRLNKNNIKTLSGKSKWGQKAITQIYKFIDSAK